MVYPLSHLTTAGDLAAAATTILPVGLGAIDAAVRHARDLALLPALRARYAQTPEAARDSLCTLLLDARIAEGTDRLGLPPDPTSHSDGSAESPAPA